MIGEIRRNEGEISDGFYLRGRKSAIEVYNPVVKPRYLEATMFDLWRKNHDDEAEDTTMHSLI